MTKTLLRLGVVIVALGGGAYAYYRYRDVAPTVSTTTATVSRGDVIETVGATGTLQAVTTVQVGTQVSGTIQELNADFNSLVRKGQVLARLDPSLFQTQIEQARANLIRAQADLERLRVALDDARTKLARARELSGRKLIPQMELEAADVNVRAAEAQLRSSEAQVTQAQASLNQSSVNLQHTVIEAPIDGLVISRNVDVGQTVAASMQAPTLFVLAADLTKMQVIANLDESDVGRIRPNQQVTFRVDAYPADTFTGTVSQVRLEPKVQQNVVTYATVIDVPNNQLKLKPGMTANVNIEIARSMNVLRVPNTALRFRPTRDMYAALGQTPPQLPAGEFAGRGGGTSRGTSAPAAATASEQTATPAPRTGRSSSSGGAAASVPPTTPPEAPADQQPASPGRAMGDAPSDAGTGRGDAPADNSTRGNGRARLAERLQNLSPEERAQFIQRARERGAFPRDNAGGADSPATTRARGTTSPPRDASQPPQPVAATTIDALFGPLPRTDTSGRVWVLKDKMLTPVRVRVGISDGQMTELIEGDIQEGAALVTNITTGAETRPAGTTASPTANPFLTQPGRGGFGGGGGRGF